VEEHRSSLVISLADGSAELRGQFATGLKRDAAAASDESKYQANRQKNQSQFFHKRYSFSFYSYDAQSESFFTV
jgi:hypothetical protein